MNEQELIECERVALADDTLIHQIATKLAAEVRRLQHALNDPAYMYAGSRIHRHAIVCRNERIEQLLKEKHAKAPTSCDPASHGTAPKGCD
jgi:hypothetical protein